MIRRVYTNGHAELELVLDGATVVVGAERRTFATADAARAAFDAGVHALAPRRATSPPVDEDPGLTWVGPDDEEERWIRIDACPCETAPEPTTDELVLADWQLEHADPHVRARGAFARGVRKGFPAHVDAWVSGQLPQAELGFRGGFVEALRVYQRAIRPEALTGAHLAAFFALPIAARLRRLVIGYRGYLHDEHRLDAQPLVDALAPSLRDVELHGGRVRDLSALPPLERLSLRRVALAVGVRITGDALRELDLDAPFDLTRCACPGLRSLAIDSRHVASLVRSDLRPERLEVRCDTTQTWEIRGALERWPGLRGVRDLAVFDPIPRDG